MQETNTSNINIIVEENSKQFVSEETIWEAVQKKMPSKDNTSIVNLQQIEKAAEALPQIKKATCFRTSKGTIIVLVKSRSPFIQIVENKTSYFLDISAAKIPIDEKNKQTSTISVTIENRNQLSNESIIKIVKQLYDHPFWSKLIQSIKLVNENVTISCNDGTIVDCGNLENAMTNLNKLYRYLTSESCNNMPKYKFYDIRYNKQIIARCQL